MARIKWTENKVDQFIKDGRGDGEFEKYKPWLTIKDFPSDGRVSRIKGFKIDRIHHFFSDMERNTFLLYEWRDEVIDIREQFPILDRVKTQEIADVMGFRHPIYVGTNVNTIMTVDFLLTIKNSNNEIITCARSVKSMKELSNKRVLQKLMIEKYYFEELGIDWKIITEKNIPQIFCQNLLEIRDSSFKIVDELDYDNIIYFARMIENINIEEQVIDILRQISIKLDIPIERSIIYFHYLILKKALAVNLFKRINLHLKWKELNEG